MKISTTALILGEGVPLCPFTFAAGPGTTANAPRPCIGEACAAWRWLRVKETDAFLNEVRDFMQTTGEKNFGRASQQVWSLRADAFEHTEGYCGVGGKPE